MTFHLLVSERMKPILSNVEVVANYGTVMIGDFEEKAGVPYTTLVVGDHMIVRGSVDAI